MFEDKVDIQRQHYKLELLVHLMLHKKEHKQTFERFACGKIHGEWKLEQSEFTKWEKLLKTIIVGTLNLRATLQERRAGKLY
jgi:hypothetical protein